MSEKIKQIETLLDACELKELLTAERAVMERLWRLKRDNKLGEQEQRSLRRDPRFETHLLGTLTRVTDVHSGQRKEFVATITDISRGGMRVRVDQEFIPSRLVELTFAGPGGKIKRTFMEVLSIKKRSNEEGQWVELGCRRVEMELVQQMKLKEELVCKVRKHLHNRQRLRILLVGPEQGEASQLMERLTGAGYTVERVKLERQSVVNALKGPYHLAIFCRGAKLRDDPGLLSEIRQTSALATLSLLEDDSERLVLLQAGIDECVTLKEQASDQLLFSAVERALAVKTISHHVRHVPTAQALLVCQDQAATTMIKYQLQECGYGAHTLATADEAMALNSEQVDMVLVAFEELETEPFKLLAGHFRQVPVVAFCQDLTKGHQAMVQGATMFLHMPPGPDDMRTLLESLELNLYLADAEVQPKPATPEAAETKTDQPKPPVPGALADASQQPPTDQTTSPVLETNESAPDEPVAAASAGLS